MLAGKRDAYALLGITSGFVAAQPWFTGNLWLAAPSLVAAAAGAGWLTFKSFRRRVDPVDRSKREGFILQSDRVPKPCQGPGGIRFGLTKDGHRALDVDNLRLTQHTAVLGQSGMGKTTIAEQILYSQTVARGGGWLFIDAKLDKDQRDRLAHIARIAGREDDFYVINTADPANSNTYNPIMNGSPDEVASRLLNLIPSSEDNPGADFYRQSANHALMTIVGALQVLKLAYTFGDLSVLLQSKEALAKLERSLMVELPDDPATRAFAIFLDQFRVTTKEGPTIDVKRLKDVLGGISGRIQTFAQGNFGRVFNTYTPEVDLTRILREGKMCYLMLPTMAKENSALQLGKMVLSDLRTAVAQMQDIPKDFRPDPPFVCMLDEMGSYVQGMPGIARLFEQGRSARVALFTLFQTFSNLKVVSEDFPNLIIQNTWNKVFFKFGSDDAEDAAELIGSTVRYQKSISAGDNEGDSNPMVRSAPTANVSAGTSVSEGWREAEEYRVTPDQIRSLGTGEAIMMSGARMFHIDTPMIVMPEGIPQYTVTRHERRLAKELEPSHFEKNYAQYVTGPGVASAA